MLPGGGLGGLNVVTGGLGPFGGAVEPLEDRATGGGGSGRLSPRYNKPLKVDYLDDAPVAAVEADPPPPIVRKPPKPVSPQDINRVLRSFIKPETQSKKIPRVSDFSAELSASPVTVAIDKPKEPEINFDDLLYAYEQKLAARRRDDEDAFMMLM